MAVHLLTEREERVAPGSVLHSDLGELVVVASRPHQQRWLVRFEGYEGRDAADRLRGLLLHAEPIDDPDELWARDVIGAEVVLAANGEAVGRCVSLVDNPAADILELDNGALVPVVFVVDHAPGRITIDPPEGLFDL